MYVLSRRVRALVYLILLNAMPYSYRLFNTIRFAVAQSKVIKDLTTQGSHWKNVHYFELRQIWCDYTIADMTRVNLITLESILLKVRVPNLLTIDTLTARFYSVTILSKYDYMTCTLLRVCLAISDWSKTQPFKN